MNEQWQANLEKCGAHIEDGSVSHYGNPETEVKAIDDKNIIADLSHYGVIRASGEEARDFLQNQLSNDIKLVNDQQSQLSSYCNPKGRMLASFRVFVHQQDLHLRLPADTLEATLKRLRMFIMRSKVSLDDVSNELVRFGICGPDAESLLANQNLTIPSQTNNSTQNSAITVIRLPGTKPRFELYGDANDMIPPWEKLSTECQMVGTNVWALQDIWMGIPDVYAATVEAFVPQMANLHAIEAVSFKKGCYPGQEVVARMQYLGKLKRRMFRGHVATDTSPQAGDNLFNPESQDSIGKIVQAQPHPNGGYDLLAVLQIAQTEKGSIHIDSTSGPQVELQELPYQVPLEREK